MRTRVLATWVLVVVLTVAAYFTGKLFGPHYEIPSLNTLLIGTHPVRFENGAPLIETPQDSQQEFIRLMSEATWTETEYLCKLKRGLTLPSGRNAMYCQTYAFFQVRDVEGSFRVSESAGRRLDEILEAQDQLRRQGKSNQLK